MRQCPICGQLINEHAKFCPICGQPTGFGDAPPQPDNTVLAPQPPQPDLSATQPPPVPPQQPPYEAQQPAYQQTAPAPSWPQAQSQQTAPVQQQAMDGFQRQGRMGDYQAEKF